MVINVCWVSGAGKNGFWLAQEFLSSSPLKMIPAETGPANIQSLIAEVARKIRVPVAGFTSNDSWQTKMAIWYLLKYSGKGPSLYCEVSNLPDRLVEAGASITRMVQQYHEYRSKNAVTDRDLLPAERRRGSETPPLDVNLGELWNTLQDWYNSGNATPEEHCDYRYNLNLWTYSYPEGGQ